MAENKEKYCNLTQEEKKILQKEAEVHAFERKFIENPKEREKVAGEAVKIIQDLIKDLEVRCGYESIFAGVSRIDSLSRVTGYTKHSLSTLLELTKGDQDVFTSLLTNYRKPVPYHCVNDRGLANELKNRFNDLFLESTFLNYCLLLYFCHHFCLIILF